MCITLNQHRESSHSHLSVSHLAGCLAPSLCSIGHHYTPTVNLRVVHLLNGLLGRENIREHDIGEATGLAGGEAKDIHTRQKNTHNKSRQQHTQNKRKQLLVRENMRTQLWAGENDVCDEQTQ